MPEELIETIIKSLEGLADCDDREISSVFASALSSARASSSRALIPNTKVGTLARYSVAASASAPLRAYLSSSTRSVQRDALMRAALDAAFKLAAAAGTKRIDDVPEVDAPEGWDKDTCGSFTLPTPLGVAEISYSPHMPGGNWTLSLAGIPVGFGTTPIENALLLTKVVEFVSEQRDRPRASNPFRSRRLA
ncbi:hypothetical protein D3C71_324190 [compost metagenome]